MRGIYIVFSLAPMALPADRWFAPDKVQHFLSSAFVQSMSYGTLRTTGLSHGASLAGATVATTGVGPTCSVKVATTGWVGNGLVVSSAT